MSFRDRLLYHQIHPMKVATDATAGTLALILLWRRHLWVEVLSVAVPSSLASMILMAGSDPERQRDSRAGRYMQQYQTAPVQVIRLGAYGVMMNGAWRRSTARMGLGIVGLLVCWFYGLWRKV